MKEIKLNRSFTDKWIDGKNVTSAKRGKAYMICIAFIWGGVMLSEFVRRVF